MSAPGAGNGEVYVFAGDRHRRSGAYGSYAADAALSGVYSGEEAGYALAGGGDVNDDGYADLLVGSPGSRANGPDSGSVYVVLGGHLQSDALDRVNSLSLYGNDAGDRLGETVSFVGDVDMDRRSDLLVGAPYTDRVDNDSGSAYLVFGGFKGNDKINREGTEYMGDKRYDQAGSVVVGGQDFNQDGHFDFVVGLAEGGFTVLMSKELGDY